MSRTGRPSGQFQKKTDRLLQMLAEKVEQQGWCLAKNEYWASRLGVSERQVSRYFSSLCHQGKIEIQETHIHFGGDRWSNQRFLVVKEAM